MDERHGAHSTDKTKMRLKHSDAHQSYPAAPDISLDFLQLLLTEQASVHLRFKALRIQNTFSAGD